MTKIVYLSIHSLFIQNYKNYLVKYFNNNNKTILILH